MLYDDDMVTVTYRYGSGQSGVDMKTDGDGGRRLVQLASYDV